MPDQVSGSGDGDVSPPSEVEVVVGRSSRRRPAAQKVAMLLRVVVALEFNTKHYSRSVSPFSNTMS